ncbi:hypothetical protein L211DRAFT_218922 [Terfezia boudieri ATCC MYA-4762]|uniref:Uncharacterized protein n=1 Tax=Terfezia boudieri ATCC MYA-4762 TaxID=1051890 RepID=A0A3N4LQE4_9PEZI|nr:hypothetical protein L211DRAFT_218922 [Terfezia boudieri ATCC MYA-4762]
MNHILISNFTFGLYLQVFCICLYILCIPNLNRNFTQELTCMPSYLGSFRGGLFSQWTAHSLLDAATILIDLSSPESSSIDPHICYFLSYSTRCNLIFSFEKIIFHLLIPKRLLALNDPSSRILA